MSIRIDHLVEPRLQFGNYFEHEDSKTGLAEYGPFGKNIPGLHPSEIRLGYIGTRETVSNAQEWIDKCATYIESENIKTIGRKAPTEATALFSDNQLSPSPVLQRTYKIINRDFVGFNRDSSFQCCFQTNERWIRYLSPKDIENILSNQDKAARIWGIVDLIVSSISSIAESDPSPDIIIIALTPEIESQADSVRLSGNFFLNLRRALKARTMGLKTPLPIQLVRTRTIRGRGDVQEVATRAWNFCTAQYYKADGIPWRPMTLEQDACYIGISFYIAQESDTSLTMRSSVAQAFDYLGQGLVLRGEPFEWDTETLGRTPHLTREAAQKLVQGALNEYVKLRTIPPRRVIIHKSSEYWGTEHEAHNEIDGFYEGISNIYPGCETDFVALRQTGVRLFREGRYPPLRGTYFTLGDQHFLYTMGFIPYLETYPKPYVPEPWQITQHIGGSSPKDLFKEVLALTKMNVNNCAFADGTPITLSFSQKIGEIMKHVPTDGVVQPRYKFYM